MFKRIQNVVLCCVFYVCTVSSCKNVVVTIICIVHWWTISGQHETGRQQNILMLRKRWGNWGLIQAFSCYVSENIHTSISVLLSCQFPNCCRFLHFAEDQLHGRVCIIYVCFTCVPMAKLAYCTSQHEWKENPILVVFSAIIWSCNYWI